VNEALVVLLGAFIGELFVVAFSLLAEALRPNSVAGILSAAPSIALPSLTITAFVSGPRASRWQCRE
jgi:hypothetical protein